MKYAVKLETKLDKDGWASGEPDGLGAWVLHPPQKRRGRLTTHVCESQLPPSARRFDTEAEAKDWVRRRREYQANRLAKGAFFKTHVVQICPDWMAA